MNKNIPTGLGIIIITIFAATAFFVVQKADAIMSPDGTSAFEISF